MQNDLPLSYLQKRPPLSRPAGNRRGGGGRGAARARARVPGLVARATGPPGRRNSAGAPACPESDNLMSVRPVHYCDSGRSGAPRRADGAPSAQRQMRLEKFCFARDRRWRFGCWDWDDRTGRPAARRALPAAC